MPCVLLIQLETLELPKILRISPTVSAFASSEVHGCSGDLESMQNSFPNGVALAENGLEHGGVGTDQRNLQRYSQLGVGFRGSGGSLDESCTLFNFVYCFSVWQ